MSTLRHRQRRFLFADFRGGRFQRGAIFGRVGGVVVSGGVFVGGMSENTLARLNVRTGFGQARRRCVTPGMKSIIPGYFGRVKNFAE
jgi:hypothetical protein